MIILRKMRLLIFIGLFTLFIIQPFQSQASKMNFLQNHAKIVSASYQGDELVVFLEVNNIVYKSHFLNSLTEDEYLYLHHNQDTYIYIVYYLTNNEEIMIHHWYRHLK